MGSHQLAEYFFYCALFHERMQAFQRQKYCLLSCLSTRCSAASNLHLAALRKLCFVDLIIFGQICKVPQWVEKANPCMSHLFDGITDFRSGGHSRKHRLETSSTINSMQGKQDIFSTNLKFISDAFQDDGLSTTRLETAIHRLEGYLKESGDLDTARLLIPAKRARFLKSLSESFSSLPVERCIHYLGTVRSEDVTEAIDFHNHLYVREGLICTVGTDSYVRFVKEEVREPTDSLSESINRMSSIVALDSRSSEVK